MLSIQYWIIISDAANSEIFYSAEDEYSVNKYSAKPNIRPNIRQILKIRVWSHYVHL